ncbi:MAG: biopolymer transporter ExbD [Kiritimatiellae bacterium]|nr:biopolymer transporter ExbD [Kiritimatiellia bacterium]
MASRSNEEPKVEMTPMIDVVFQLLIFFVVTLKQEDILAKLMASRPAPDPNAKPDQQPDLIDITVHKHGFIFKQRAVSLEGLDRQIERYSRMSKNATVIIRCTSDSKQRYLVQAMDICSKYKMKNLSIFSM